jgi:ribonucleoside-diphosphate reductase alpha chain
MPGPSTTAAVSVFQQKYCQRGEDFRDVCNRVAGVTSDNPGHFHSFRDIILDGRFVPAGRILASLGTTKRVTPYNCFVSGTIGDSLNGDGSIMDRLGQAARTMQMGGGIGYDFSTIRPRGDSVKSVGGKASGPVSYMHVFNEMGRTISSAGERRGAQMGILRVDHPDIEEFVHSKRDQKSLNCFNISVAVTDKFMEAVREDDEFELVFEDRVYRKIRARVLWETIMRNTWDWAEPGVVFIDRINKTNNLQYWEKIAATNPCSEQPLPPFGACLLGSFNLVRYLEPIAKPTELGNRYRFNIAMLRDDIGHVVRAMDNVVDVAVYPLGEQAMTANDTRRMGLGVLGVANALEALGTPYGSDGFLHNLDGILGLIKNKAYEASALLAKEKCSFPAFARSLYMESKFVEGLDDRVKELIGRYGIRNSHLTSIAPTGTISFCMDNVSSGIEPVFSERSRRKVRLEEGEVEMEIADYGAEVLGVKARTSAEVTVEQHIKVLTVAQKHVDSAISKTVNVPANTAWANFKEVYMSAWELGAKGCATYQDGGMREGIIKSVETSTGQGYPDMSCASGMCER